MKNKNTFNLLALICFVSLSLWSCVDNNDYGLPKLEENCVVDDPNQTISSIESLVKNFTGAKEITEDVVLSGYVISNDAGGNFYQQIIIQDNNSTEYNGIEIDASLKGYNDYFPIGARVKVMAKGLYIAKDRGVVKLGVKDTKYPVGRIPEKEVFQHLKFYCNNEIVAPQPKVYTDISQALQEGNTSTTALISTIIRKN